MPRRTGTLMWVATAAWVVSAIIAVVVGELAQAAALSAFAGAGALIASGAAERTAIVGWLTGALLAIAVLIYLFVVA